MGTTPQTTSKSTGRELLGILWNELIKKWLDFAAYLRQRRVVMRHPLLDFPDESMRQASWKGPVAFAVQGAVLSAALVGVTGGMFSLLIKPRPVLILRAEVREDGASLVPKLLKREELWSKMAEWIKSDLAKLRVEYKQVRSGAPDQMFPGPIPFSRYDKPVLFTLGVATSFMKRPRNEVLVEYDAEISRLEFLLRRAELAPRMEAAQKVMGPLLAPVALFLGAYVFKLLARKTPDKSGLRNSADAVYLYHVTASLFWANLCFATIQAVSLNMDKYFPRDMTGVLMDLESALDQGTSRQLAIGDHVRLLLGGMAILTILWAYWVIRRSARRIAEPLGLGSAKGKWYFYRGEAKVRKDILAANAVSGFLLFITMIALSLLWALIGEWLEKFKI
jgi:hypothetical protein